MKYRGRIVALIIVLTMNIIRYFYMCFTFDVVLDPLSNPLIIGMAFFGWWLGKKYDEAKFYSEKDALTEVYNRRFAAQVFPKLLALVNRNQGKLSVLLIDVNNFKEI
jgi:GGDEF domain-containing protein